ncbi:hypothetical protein [Streptomyces sp. NPDC000983]|uniref:hypothetical protein n=1 Tax=Streptomyces sp. NPDC000983 TaxID=3154373 RepID=UPI003332624F
MPRNGSRGGPPVRSLVVNHDPRDPAGVPLSLQRESGCGVGHPASTTKRPEPSGMRGLGHLPLRDEDMLDTQTAS